MKKLVIFLFLSLFTESLFSQFDAQTSQYMLNHTAFNPAAAGESGMIDLSGQHRLNWLGIPNAGSTTLFNINTAIKTENNLHGVGLSFIDDNFGGFTNQTFHVQYAYKMKLGDGLLSLGTDLGFVSLGFTGDSVSKHPITLGTFHNLTSDPELPTTGVVGMGFDIGLGAWFSTDKFYLGLSYLHLNEPTVDWGTNSEFTQHGLLNFTAGYSYKMEDPKYILKPSTLLKTDFRSFQLDLGSRIEYDGKYWGGLAYRFQDAVVILAGINVAGGLSIGYSYDIPASKMITVSSGSHEIALIYSFEYVFTKSNTKYKSIRIL